MHQLSGEWCGLSVVQYDEEVFTDPDVSDELYFIFLVSSVQRPLPVQFNSLKCEKVITTGQPNLLSPHSPGWFSLGRAD